MMPRAWAAATASATGIAMRSTSARRIPCRGNQRIEALAPDVLHHDEVVAVRRFDLVNGDDVRMIERRGGLRLLHEPAAAILVRQAVGGQHLDRHLAAQTRIARAVHLAHAARAEQREYLVRAELRAGGEPHVCVPKERECSRTDSDVDGHEPPDVAGTDRLLTVSMRFSFSVRIAVDHPAT